MIDRQLIMSDRQVSSVLINCLSCLLLSLGLHLVWLNPGLVDTVTDNRLGELEQACFAPYRQEERTKSETQTHTCRKTTGGGRAIILMGGGV